MDFISGNAFYRTTQIVSVLFLPMVVAALCFIRVEDRIVVDGVVGSDNQVILRSPLDDTLLEDILVKPGDDVAKGDPLVQFQDLKNWRQNLAKKQKQAVLLQEKAEIFAKLYGEGAQSGLAVKDRINELQVLEIEIGALQENISRLTLRAPFPGRITELMVQPYAKVDIGTPLMAFSAMDEKVIRCSIPESRFPYLRVGQKVAVKSNLYNYFSYKIYSGVVKSYYNYSSSSGQGPAYETKIALTGEAKELLTIGSTARCEIRVDARPLYWLLFGGRKK